MMVLVAHMYLRHFGTGGFVVRIYRDHASNVIEV